MARQTSSDKTSKSKNTGSRPRAAAKQTASNASRRKPGAANARSAKTERAPRFLDERAKNDIAAIVLGVVAVVLFVLAVLPTDAVLSSALSFGLHMVFGLGAYFLPLFLLGIAITFLVRFERERMSTRVTVGLIVAFIGILAEIALFTPIDPAGDFLQLFAADNLMARGGYLGAAFAWLGLSLLGQVVSAIIMAGVILIGLAIIGFSLTGIVARLRERIGATLNGKQDDDDFLPVAQIQKKRARKADLDDGGETAEQLTMRLDGTSASSAKTTVLPTPSERTDRRPRRTRATLDALEADASATEPSVEEVEPVKGHSAPMTRKLGKQDNPTPASSSKPAAKKQQKPAKKREATPIAAPQPQEGFQLPSMNLLAQGKPKGYDKNLEAELQDTAGCLQDTLEDFGIMAKVVGWVAGPTVTLFKVDLPSGVRVSRITALNDDIALSLAAPGVRIFAPIPGTNYVGIEVPNRSRESVLLGDVLKEAKDGPLQIAIGKDVEGHCIVSDLAKMPHLLIGGTTGSGKSVSINAMIMSILMRATPAEVRFIMIDPKRVEFTPYNGIPHLYVPVVTEAKEASSALQWGVAEMERRLKVFSKVGARNIGQYNAKAISGDLAEDDPEAKQLPYIVIIIDELADLMMNVGKEVEFSISRIAQLARAAGIHLIVATQRPSTNVVTGLIKANITNRISFNVASGIDSRVILDTPGAENLIGLGDLLFSKPEFAKPQRIQGCYVSEDEINAVVDMLKAQGEPEYHSEILQTNIVTLGASSPDGSGGGSTSDDPLLWEAADIVVSSGLGSTSNIQRRLKVGYSRAGRIMDMLEEHGIVGPPNGSKPRDVLVDAMELETLKAFESQDD